MTGYENPKEQQKAAEVRELISKARKLWEEEVDSTTREQLIKLDQLGHEYYDKAEILSLELTDYLRLNYPKNFIYHKVFLGSNELERIFHDKKEIDKYIRNYNIKLNIHDIAIFTVAHNIRYYALFNDNGNPVISTDRGNMLSFGNEFYDFLEELGLTPDAANKLYGFEEGRGKYIVSLDLNKWPNKVKSSSKII